MRRFTLQQLVCGLALAAGVSSGCTRLTEVDWSRIPPADAAAGDGPAGSSGQTSGGSSGGGSGPSSAGSGAQQGGTDSGTPGAAGVGGDGTLGAAAGAGGA
jgi:hypothetical protein